MKVAGMLLTLYLAVTLANLVTAAQTHANMQGGGPYSSTEWNDYVNRAMEALWIDVCAANNTFRVTTLAFTISSSATPSTALPNDFMSCLKVVLNAGTSSEQIVYRSSEATGGPITYRLEGNMLFIDPYDRSPGTYQLRYVPLLVQLDVSHSMDAELAQHRECVERLAGIYALADEEASITDQRKMLYGDTEATRATSPWGRAMMWASRQRSSEPDKVRDTRGRRGLRYPFFGVG